MPTPLPRISTFIVLPRPPGISSVFSASRLHCRSSVRLRSRLEFGERQQKVRLIEKAERRAALRFGRRADAREVDVRGDVLLARLAQPRRAPCGLRAGRSCAANRSSACPASASPSRARAPRDRSRSGSANPRVSAPSASRIQSTRAQIDFDAPARFELDAEIVEIRRRARGVESGPSISASRAVHARPT